MAYAHSRNERGQRQALVAHRRGVADLAARFAADLGAADLARWLGLWHDNIFRIVVRGLPEEEAACTQ